MNIVQIGLYTPRKCGFCERCIMCIIWQDHRRRDKWTPIPLVETGGFRMKLPERLHGCRATKAYEIGRGSTFIAYPVEFVLALVLFVWSLGISCCIFILDIEHFESVIIFQRMNLLLTPHCHSYESFRYNSVTWSQSRPTNHLTGFLAGAIQGGRYCHQSDSLRKLKRHRTLEDSK